ncbi:Basic leucine zipper 23 [Bienertia sinuspersici]
MDDGEVEPSSDSIFLPNPSTSNSDTINKYHNNNNHNNNSNSLVSASVDSLFDELLKHTRTCTHTHTCNPPGPDAAHTHTCYHTHTQVFSSEEDTKIRSSLKPKRPLGNREAVRKYREKKKAHTAFLEEEVKKLRLMNEHLLKKVQGQAALEAEILRLRSLLLDFRGKIDIEMSTFLGQNHCSSNTDISSFKEGEYPMQSTGGKAIRLQCQTQVPCFLPTENQCMSTTNDGDKTTLSWQQSCQPVILECHGNGNEMVGGSDHRFEDVETLVPAKNQSQ